MFNILLVKNIIDCRTNSKCLFLLKYCNQSLIETLQNSNKLCYSNKDLHNILDTFRKLNTFVNIDTTDICITYRTNTIIILF